MGFDEAQRDLGSLGYWTHGPGLLIQPVQFQAKERPPHHSRVKLQLRVNADVLQRCEEDDIAVLSIHLQLAVEGLQVGPRRGAFNPSANGVCVRVALAGDSVSVDTQVSLSGSEEEQVPGPVMKALNHGHPFGCWDHLPMIVAHNVTFRNRSGCNHSCSQESITLS